jgi:hypothetical protein
MNPAITQAMAAEKIKDLHALAAAERRARQFRRPGARSSRRCHVLPGLRVLPGPASASLASAACQP